MKHHFNWRKISHYTNNLPWQAVRQLLVLTPDFIS
jgi:hypothetical protein